MRLHLGDCLEVLPRYLPRSPSFPDPVPLVDMVFADLPYGVTCNKWDTPIDLARLWPLLLQVAKPNAAFVFTATQPFATSLIMSQRKMFRYDLIWEKSRPVGFFGANRRPLRAHECVVLFARGRITYNPQKTPGKPYRAGRRNFLVNYRAAASAQPCGSADGTRFPRSVLRMPQDGSGGEHPTAKPVALLEWLIKTYSNPGDLILDPVMGSGTTGVACANTGRNFLGIEKEWPYFQTAIRRLREARSKAA